MAVLSNTCGSNVPGNKCLPDGTALFAQHCHVKDKEEDKEIQEALSLFVCTALLQSKPNTVRIVLTALVVIGSKSSATNPNSQMGQTPLEGGSIVKWNTGAVAQLGCSA